MTKPRARQLALDGLGGAGRVARVRRGVDAQLTAQRKLGHLEPVDTGLVAIARTLADALDSEWSDPDGSRYTVGALAGRLVPVLLELRGMARDGADELGGVDAELQRLAATIRDATRSHAPDVRGDNPGASGTPTP